MNEDFNWEQAEEAVAATRATFADYAPTAEEAERRRRNNDQNRIRAFKERIRREINRIAGEAWGQGDASTHGLESELLIFYGEIGECLDSMPAHESVDWLVQNMATIERLHARTEKEKDHALRALVGLRGALDYIADFLEDTSAPAPTEGPTEGPTEDGEGEIPWDDEDDADEEEEFHQIATREIVASYRSTATCIRENLIARFRGTAARLGLQAAEHSPDPWRRGLNGDLGHFMGRIEVMLRGICPLEAHVWLESNIEEFESLRISTPREYDQAAQVLAVLSDRLFGLIYEIAREK